MVIMHDLMTEIRPIFKRCFLHQYGSELTQISILHLEGIETPASKAHLYVSGVLTILMRVRFPAKDARDAKILVNEKDAKLSNTKKILIHVFPNVVPRTCNLGRK